MPSIAPKTYREAATKQAYTGMNPSFASALRQLIAASGGRLWIKSGFRSVERQQQLWNAALKKYGSAQAARKWVAPPGKSNHNHGTAVDIGGDMALLRRLGPQFGLRQPMSWEPWHWEPVEQADNADAMTDPPDDHAPEDNFSQNMNSLAAMFGVDLDASYEPTSTGTAPSGGEITDVDSFMQRLAGVESGGNYSATNKRTGASGKYQIMPSNWAPWAQEAGLAGAARTPENQERVAKYKMQQYYNQFKDWRAVAVAWYAGPDDAALWLKNPNNPRFNRKQGKGNEPSINEYVARVS